MKDKTELSLKLYKVALASALQREKRQSSEAIADAEREFDTLTRAGKASGDFAFKILYGALGRDNSRSMTKKVSDLIEAELAKVNSTVKIETSPKLRMQRNVETHNRLVSACEIEVNGQPFLTAEEKESAKAKLPFNKVPVLYESRGSDNRRIFVEVTF